MYFSKKVFSKSKHRWICPQKIYKLRQTKLSQFVYFSLVLREREETKNNYSAPYDYLYSDLQSILVEMKSFVKLDCEFKKGFNHNILLVLNYSLLVATIYVVNKQSLYSMFLQGEIWPSIFYEARIFLY